MFKLVSDWIEIEYVEDEREDSDEFEASFLYNNKRYFLYNFMRAHNNPWGGLPSAPEYIHAYDAENYWTPIFIELADSGDCVRVYVEVNENDE